MSSEAGAQGGGYVRYSSPPINHANPYSNAGPSSFGGSMQQQQQQSSGGYYAGGGGQGSQMGGNLGGNMQGGQPQGGSYGAWNNAGGAPGMGNMMNDATAQMGMQFGAQIAAAGGAYMEKNVSPCFAQRYVPRRPICRSATHDLRALHTRQINAFFSLPSLKHSYNVSNSYVLHKLRLVLFPWRHKPWSRSHRHGSAAASASAAYGDMGVGAQGGGKSNGGEGYLPPRDDVNSPDLYIPSESVC